MKTLNRYYNKIKRMTCNIYHDELYEVLKNTAAEYGPDENLEKVMGTPEEFISSYFSELPELPERNKIGLTTRLSPVEFTQLFLVVSAVVVGLRVANEYFFATLSDMGYQFLTLITATGVYLLAYRLLTWYFDDWISTGAEVIHQLVALMFTVPAIYLQMILTSYSGSFLTLLSPIGFMVVLVLTIPVFARNLQKKISPEAPKYFLFKPTFRQLLAEVLPKIAVLILLISLIDPVNFTIIIVAEVICGILYFWAIGKSYGRIPETESAT